MTRCTNCDKEPIGVTMTSDMTEWRCPYCGTYNEFDA